MEIRQEELRAIVLRPIEGKPFGEDDNENNGNPHPPHPPPSHPPTPRHDGNPPLPPPPPPPLTPPHVRNVRIRNTTEQVLAHPMRTMQIPVQEDDQYEDYYSNAEENVADEKFRMLEERLRAMENQDVMGMDFNDMGLVPGLRIPNKLKVPEFIKYKCNSCPKTHVRAYFRKMSAYSNDEKMLMHFFQDSLLGGSLDWYMSLERANVRS